ncbi:hypothetical protein OGV29_19210 [Citrobacter sp. Cb013]|uniref:hypothetical protein n=1 Tax=Citrobacter sp. Cb013 TaxID=2985013 RepID=UPI00257A8259|nr:hypothetical protein [Citrobacter sp. Cb013]MDM3390904.1 hypothetical protein [Citrobacter sp. Cb013]
MVIIKRLCLAILLLTWGGYYLNFGLDGALSKQTEVWGQFGDYVGGVVNPILSFVTIYLLIHSLGLQRESNDNLINEIKRQEKLEEYKKFEFRFFRLLESQESSFSRFKINIDQSADGTVQSLNGATAVTFIVNNLSIFVKGKIEKDRVVEWLNGIEDDGAYFSLARRFYLILKLIDENTSSEDEREEMYEALLNLTDIKNISMIAILTIYYDWDAIKYIRDSKILDRDGLREFIALNTTGVT